MKMTLLVFTLLYGLNVAAAAQGTGTAPTPVFIDSLMTQFARAWSADDTTAIARLLAPDVVLYENTATTGYADVYRWASQHVFETPTLTVEPIRTEAFTDTAYQMGTWAMGDTRGIHTFVWQHQPDGRWRIRQMYIMNSPAR